MAQVAKQLEEQPGTSAECFFFLFWAPLKAKSLGKCGEILHPNEKYVTPTSKKAHKTLYLFGLGGTDETTYPSPYERYHDNNSYKFQ